MGGGEEEKKAFISCSPFPQLAQHAGVAVSLHQEDFCSLQSCFPSGGGLQNLLQALLTGLLTQGILLSSPFPPCTPPDGQFCAAAASQGCFSCQQRSYQIPQDKAAPRSPQQLHPLETWEDSSPFPADGME